AGAAVQPSPAFTPAGACQRRGLGPPHPPWDHLLPEASELRGEDTAWQEALFPPALQSCFWVSSTRKASGHLRRHFSEDRHFQKALPAHPPAKGGTGSASGVHP